MTNNEDSLKKRSGIKMIAAIIGIPLSMVTQFILPRAFGAKEYGMYSYNMNFFNSILSFLDTGTSSAFYSKLSRRTKESGLVKFYAVFILMIFVILNIFVFASFILGINNSIWEDQIFTYVFFGMFAAFMIFVVQIIISMSDAYVLTIISEITKLVQKVVLVLGILMLFYINKLTITTFYYITVITLICVVVVMIFAFCHKGKLVIKDNHLGKKQFKNYTKEFYRYCSPIFVLTLVNSLVAILERWIIQKSAGTLEQAYFGLASQMSVILCLITAPVMSLLVREFSIPIVSNNKIALASIYSKSMKVLYGIVAYFACFIMINADYVIELIGGEEYVPAIPVLRVMMIYTIHQTWGQINGNMFFASERTKQYSVIGTLGIALTIVFDYFFLMPVSVGGLGLGALGLGLKMIFAQLIVSNISVYVNSKYLGIRYRDMALFQLMPIIIFTIIGLSSRYVLDFAFGKESDNILPTMLGQGIVYTVCVIVAVYIYPVLVGVNRDFINNIIRKVIKR